MGQPKPPVAETYGGERLLLNTKVAGPGDDVTMSSDQTTSTELCAERYLLTRQEFRATAREEFLRCKPGVNGLIAAVSELVASLTHFLSGR
ncbi:MAG TPA: hypothetical protein VGP64_03915, partial [Polyangia bacterium]